MLLGVGGACRTEHTFTFTSLFNRLGWTPVPEDEPLNFKPTSECRKALPTPFSRLTVRLPDWHAIEN
eukprot:1153581-Pelagomonas_calceolata.AAC.1